MAKFILWLFLISSTQWCCAMSIVVAPPAAALNTFKIADLKKAQQLFADADTWLNKARKNHDKSDEELKDIRNKFGFAFNSSYPSCVALLRQFEDSATYNLPSEDNNALQILLFSKNNEMTTAQLAKALYDRTYTAFNRIGEVQAMLNAPGSTYDYSSILKLCAGLFTNVRAMRDVYEKALPNLGDDLIIPATVHDQSLQSSSSSDPQSAASTSTPVSSTSSVTVSSSCASTASDGTMQQVSALPTEQKSIWRMLWPNFLRRKK